MCDAGWRFVEHAPWGTHHVLRKCVPSSLAPRKRSGESSSALTRVRAAVRLDMQARDRCFVVEHTDGTTITRRAQARGDLVERADDRTLKRRANHARSLRIASR
jgi:hypothetical protein